MLLLMGIIGHRVCWVVGKEKGWGSVNRDSGCVIVDKEISGNVFNTMSKLYKIIVWLMTVVG